MAYHSTHCLLYYPEIRLFYFSTGWYLVGDRCTILFIITISNNATSANTIKHLLILDCLTKVE